MGGPKVTTTDGVAQGDIAAVKGVYTLNLTGKGTGDLNGKKIDGQTITWSNNLNDTMADFVNAYNAAGKNYEASFDTATSTLTLTAKKAGAIAADPNTDTGITVTKKTAGAAATRGPVAAETTVDFTGKTGTDVLGGTVKINGKTYQFVADAADAKAGNEAVVIAKDANATAIGDALVAKTTAALTAGGVTYDVTNTTGKISIKEQGTPSGTAKALTAQVAGIGLSLQIGDTSDDFNKQTVSVGDMHAKALGIADLTIADQTGAAAAIQSIKDAINSVSSTRGDLGAIQNRLEHTQNNLSVMTENIQDAESTIRDTDVADEMMAYTKNNILIQSAQAMLAQANQVPQGVLQLLQ